MARKASMVVRRPHSSITSRRILPVFEAAGVMQQHGTRHLAVRNMLQDDGQGESCYTFFPRPRLWIAYCSDMALPLIGKTGNGKITRVP